MKALVGSTESFFLFEEKKRRHQSESDEEKEDLDKGLRYFRLFM